MEFPSNPGDMLLSARGGGEALSNRAHFVDIPPRGPRRFVRHPSVLAMADAGTYFLGSRDPELERSGCPPRRRARKARPMEVDSRYRSGRAGWPCRTGCPLLRKD